jgi:hypothetical protein
LVLAVLQELTNHRELQAPILPLVQQPLSGESAVVRVESLVQIQVDLRQTVMLLQADQAAAAD